MPISETGDLIRSDPKKARIIVKKALLDSGLHMGRSAARLAVDTDTLTDWVQKLNMVDWLEGARDHKKANPWKKASE